MKIPHIYTIENCTKADLERFAEARISTGKRALDSGDYPHEYHAKLAGEYVGDAGWTVNLSIAKAAANGFRTACKKRLASNAARDARVRDTLTKVALFGGGVLAGALLMWAMC